MAGLRIGMTANRVMRRRGGESIQCAEVGLAEGVTRGLPKTFHQAQMPGYTSANPTRPGELILDVGQCVIEETHGQIATSPGKSCAGSYEKHSVYDPEYSDCTRPVRAKNMPPGSSQTAFYQSNHLISHLPQSIATFAASADLSLRRH
jgi:hypothetical protein